MKSVVMPVLQVKIDSLENDERCAEMLATLKSAESLDVFSLAGNSYGLGFFEELAPHLRKLHSIKKLILCDIFISRKDEIVPSLKVLNEVLQDKGIVYFDISSNALCPDGTAAISDIIATNPIKHLLLNHVALSRDGSTALCNAIEKGKLKLRSLQVCKNRIEDRGEDFARVFRDQDELEEVVLYQNAIKGAAMLAVVKALATCRNLQRLDLCDNVLDEDSTDALHALVEQCSELVSLNIGDCNIEEEPAERFFAAVEKARPAKLESLVFNYNDVKDLRCVAECLKACPALKTFQFKHFEPCAKATVDASKTLGGVMCEWESGDEDDDDGEVEAEQLKMNKMMEELAALKL